MIRRLDCARPLRHPLPGRFRPAPAVPRVFHALSRHRASPGHRACTSQVFRNSSKWGDRHRAFQSRRVLLNATDKCSLKRTFTSSLGRYKREPLYDERVRIYSRRFHIAFIAVAFYIVFAFCYLVASLYSFHRAPKDSDHWDRSAKATVKVLEHISRELENKPHRKKRLAPVKQRLQQRLADES